MTTTPVYLWPILAVVFFGIEISLPSFGFLFAGFSAILAAVPAFFGVRWEIQAVVFALSLMLGLTLLRPRLLKRFEGRSLLPSRTEALLGRRGQVTEAVDPARGTGRVTVDHQDWSARAAETLTIGTSVEVTGADGIVLIVKPIGNRS